MAETFQTSGLATNLTRVGRAMGRLSADDTIFRAAVDAFRAEDAESFANLLNRFQLGVICEDICRWFCSKTCVLECIELCAPPRTEITVEQIPAFAELIARITGDEELVERLADIIDRRDAASFKAFVKEQKIESFCHLLCHWACGVRCGLRCEVLCAPREVVQREYVGALALAGAAVGRLAKDKKQLQTVINAALALDCEILTGILGEFNDCFFICAWICSWRCALVCLPLCRQFPPVTDVSIEEMRAFAQVTARLAENESAYSRFVAAIRAQDAKAFAALVQEFKLERFCLQLCHWICFEICRLFCICVCPQPETIPLFTHVGNYHVDPMYGDFKADGTTSDHGWAFTQTVDLKGILPDGTAPDALEYRFTYQNLSGGGTLPITGAMIPGGGTTVIGQLEYWEWDATLTMWVVHSHDYYVNNPGATVTIQQNPGPALSVGVDTDTDADGWIQVPRQNSLFIGGVGRFVPTGFLAKLDTTKLTTEVFDLTPAAPPLPLKAGDAMPAAQKSVKPVFKINFEARKVVGLAGVSANSLAKIALSNTFYTYNRHPDWAGSPPPVSTIPVMSLDIAELIAGGGCNPLSKKLHALFTAYHPYLATLNLYLEGPAPLPATINPAISADGEADSPGGGQLIDISGLKPCAYILWLTSTLNLTDGYVQKFGTFNDHIAFCVH